MMLRRKHLWFNCFTFQLWRNELYRIKELSLANNKKWLKLHKKWLSFVLWLFFIVWYLVQYSRVSAWKKRWHNLNGNDSNKSKKEAAATTVVGGERERATEWERIKFTKSTYIYNLCLMNDRMPKRRKFVLNLNGINFMKRLCVYIHSTDFNFKTN